jgi:hypothetical protein
LTEEAPAAEERALRAEAALRAALQERNQLWAELQKRRSTEQDLAFWRNRAEDMERSRWWRAGAPLRLVKRVLSDPAAALSDSCGALRERRRLK